MSSEYLPSVRAAAAYAESDMSFFSMAIPLTVLSTVGTATVYGPPVITGSTVTVAATAAGALRDGHRLAVYRITGGAGVGGTFTATIWTFITSRDVATPVIIARPGGVIDMSTTGGWALRDSTYSLRPLVIAEPGFGIKASVAAAGSDGTILTEWLCKLIPTSIPKPA